jgi:protein phosphatase
MWRSGDFEKELESLYPGANAAEEFSNVFMWVPFGAIVNKTSLCLHGGIGPSLPHVSLVGNLYRPVATYENDMILTIVWSDPSESTDGFLPSARGTGYRYGPTALSTFLKQSRLERLIRGHECAEEGIQWQCNRKVVTVFSPFFRVIVLFWTLFQRIFKIDLWTVRLSGFHCQS